MTDTTEQVVDTTAPDAIEPEAIEPQVQAESSPAVTDADETSEPKPKGVQKRIDELTRNWREAERREAALLAMLQQKTPAQPEPAKSEPQVATRPKLEDFNYDETAYQAALDEYYEKKADEVVERKLSQREQERQKTERVKSWKTREAEFKAKNPDYEELAYFAPISDAMGELIQESEHGPELAYYLGKPENREEALRIAQLDPVKAAREMGRLEAKFEKPAIPPAPKPVAVSKAPPPPPRIEAVEHAVTIRPDSPESDKAMSDDEWFRARNKQLARKK
jgi:hypothetical protein